MKSLSTTQMYGRSDDCIFSVQMMLMQVYSHMQVSQFVTSQICWVAACNDNQGKQEQG